MLGKYLGAACVLTMTSAVAWMGCSSDDPATPPPTNDGGGTTTPPAGDDDGGPGGGKTKTDAGGGLSTPGKVPAPEVSFTYGTCAPLKACGGDAVGTWKYAAGGCVAELATAACPDLVVKSSTVKARGVVTIGVTSLERNIEVAISASVVVPASCTMGASCALVPFGLKAPPPQGPGFQDATCKDGTTAGTCECDVTKLAEEKTTDTYTTSGSRITTGAGLTYDYCVANGKMTYRERFQNIVDGNVVMTK